MAPIPPSHFDSTFGCIFFAVVFSSVLWGVVCLQVYLYLERYWRTDKPWLKINILLIWMLDIVQQIFLLHSSYVYLVKGIYDQSLLISLPRTLTLNALINSFINVMVQTIFIRRAWYISDKNPILSINLAYFGQVYNLTELPQLSKAFPIELALDCIVLFTDSLLASVLVYLLWRSRSGFGRTDSIIKRLVMYTIGSDLVTALWAVMALVSVLAAPDSFIYLMVDLVIPNLYLNCVLALLNAHSSLREALVNKAGGPSICFENIPPRNPSSSIPPPSPRN